jgi:hypothetical protein
MPNKHTVVALTTQSENGAVQVEVALPLRPRRTQASPDFERKRVALVSVAESLDTGHSPFFQRIGPARAVAPIPSKIEFKCAGRGIQKGVL